MNSDLMMFHCIHPATGQISASGWRCLVL